MPILLPAFLLAGVTATVPTATLCGKIQKMAVVDSLYTDVTLAGATPAVAHIQEDRTSLLLLAQTAFLTGSTFCVDETDEYGVLRATLAR